MEHQVSFDLLRAAARKAPSSVATRHKVDGVWQDTKWKQLESSCKQVARALLALGVEPEERVGIISQTRIEWTLCDFGIGACGAMTLGIYPSNLADDCAYILEYCDTRVLFVENEEQLVKILSVRGRLPALGCLILFDGSARPEHEIGDLKVMGWSEFLDLASTIEETRFERRLASVHPEDAASLVCTSGTTGLPKMAILTHKSLLFASWSCSQRFGIRVGDETLLFLPLAHVFARLMVYAAFDNMATVAYAESFDKIGENLRETRPHFIASVPRVFEKIREKIFDGKAKLPPKKQRIFDWALRVGTERSILEEQGKRVPLGLRLKHAVAERLIFRKIREHLGGRMTWAISGAAPLDPEVARFFHACGLLILEGIGMTENSSFSNINTKEKFKFGTVGPTGPGIEMKVAEDGEVLFRGDNIMKGYFKNPEATAETIDEDGWLHTGDIGEIDEDGYLKITDRKKDLIVTAGGKNIAPQRIERIVRSSRYISQVVAFGDKKKFISALITLDGITISEWATAENLDATDMKALARDSRVRDLIAREVEQQNQKLASYEQVKKFHILEEDLSIDGGELTPTLKIKRRVVKEKHGHHIDALYS